MKKKLFPTREAEKMIGIQGSCPQNIRVAFNRSVKRLGIEPVATRRPIRNGKNAGGQLEKLWSEEQIVAIYEDYWAHCKNPSAKKPLVFDVAEPVEVEGKKIMPATAATGQETNANNHADDTTNRGVAQQFSSLPAEILALNRWLPTRKDKPKAPVGEQWQLPENQKPFAEVEGIKGFVASTEANGGLLFVDFDHCINSGTGEFINACAADWFNRIQQGKYFAELSTSKTGAHMWALPTAGDSAKTTGKIYLTEDKKSFIEVFYGTNKFCLPTGKLFRCQPNAPIATGEEADKILQELRAALADQKAKEQPKQARVAPRSYEPLSDNPEYDQWRAQRMLDVIDPARLSYDDWFAVHTSCKTVGLSYSIVDNFNRRDTSLNGEGKPRYNERANLAKWNEPANADFNIETLHGIAKRFGYSEKDSAREWLNLRGDRKSTDKPAPMEPPAEDNFVRTQDRIKSCPVNLRLPSNYLFGKNGIELVVPAKKENADPKYIFVATPIVPVKSFRDALKGTVVYEMAILDKGKWRTTEVEGRTLSDPRAALDFANFGASIDEPKYLCKFFTAIKLLNQDLIEIKAYNQTGWTTEDYDAFALPVDDKSIVRRPGYDYERIFKPRGDREAWKNKFVEITEQGGAVAKTIIGTCCAAPLVRPLKLLNLQVHLHGKRSAGKTPLLKFGVSIYGDANVGALAYTFSATPKARLETAAAFRDLPIIAEELESINDREIERLPQDIYNYALGIGGQALNKDQSRKEPKLFSGARLTSGEHPLVQGNGNGGEFKRVLELRCGQILDVDFAADLHGFCDDNRGLFGEQWIRYVVENRATIAKQYHQALSTVKAKQRRSAHANDDTQLATLVVSAIAYQHFKICIGLQEVGDDMELDATLNAIICTLPTVDEIDDSKRAIEFLQSFVAGNEKSFVHMVRDIGTGRVTDLAQYNAECYGKIYPDGRVAFLPHALKKILQGQGGFKSADKLIAEFADQGKIQVSLVKENPLGYAKICGCTKRAYIFKSYVIHDSDSEYSEDDESVG